MKDMGAFDPTQHLSQINGNAYLEVKWRLVWLRAEHPDAHIQTELVSHANDEAVFRAVVTIPDGGSATGWGSENARSFGEYLEKAETKAIGRALAALGYGTQFCTDFDFGAGQDRVVDAPVARQPQHTGQWNQNHTTPTNGTLRMSERQVKMIYAKCKAANVSPRAFALQYGPSDSLDDLPGGRENVDRYVAILDGYDDPGAPTQSLTPPAYDGPEPENYMGDQ